mgnify:CR=1 FL=1
MDSTLDVNGGLDMPCLIPINPASEGQGNGCKSIKESILQHFFSCQTEWNIEVKICTDNVG